MDKHSKVRHSFRSSPREMNVVGARLRHESEGLTLRVAMAFVTYCNRLAWIQGVSPE